MSHSQSRSESKWDVGRKTCDAWIPAANHANTGLIPDIEWLSQNRAVLMGLYPKRHLAILNNAVVADGNTVFEAFRKARERYPSCRPLLTYMDNQTMGL